MTVSRLPAIWTCGRAADVFKHWIQGESKMTKSNHLAFGGLLAVVAALATQAFFVGCQTPFTAQSSSVDLSTYGVSAISAVKSSDEAVATVSCSGTTLSAASVAAGSATITVTCTGSTSTDTWTDAPVSIAATVDSTGAVTFASPDTSKAIKASSVVIPTGMNGKSISVDAGTFTSSGSATEMGYDLNFTSDAGGTYTYAATNSSGTFTYDESSGLLTFDSNQNSMKFDLKLVNDSTYLFGTYKMSRSLGGTGLLGETWTYTDNSLGSIALALTSVSSGSFTVPSQSIDQEITSISDTAGIVAITFQVSATTSIKMYAIYNGDVLYYAGGLY